MTPAFLPSQVVLSTPPLTACFGRCEAECAAALIVWALRKTGDTFRAIRLKEIGSAMSEALESDPRPEPIRSWNRNPFFNPYFHLLLRDGFIEESGSDGETRACSFTEKGLERLARWVPSSAPEAR